MSDELEASNGRGKHPQIDRDIRRLIVSGRWKPGQKVPTWDELELRFDVARGTIMRAMEALKADGFVESRGRRRGTVVAERPPHLFQYGLVFPYWPEDKRRWSMFCDAVRREAERIATATGFRIRLYAGVREPVDRPEVQRLLRDVRGRCMAGIILDECLISTARRILDDAGWLPRVAIGWPIGEKGIPALQLQIDLFVKRAVDFLAGRGRRKVAILVASKSPDDESNASWPRHIAERGMTTKPGWQLFVPPNLSAWAAHSMQLMFSPDQPHRPDGLIIVDDHLVEQATLGIAATGVAVPRDLDIVALCNYPWPAPHAVPVTRLGYDATAIARACIDVLEMQRRGQAPPALTQFPPLFEEELPG